MKIVVAVKQVAILEDGFALRSTGHGVDPGSVEWELNEWDAFSLEAALQIHESATDGEVLVVTVGEPRADDVLLDCLAHGADRALRIWDDSLEEVDVLAVAGVLAAAVRRESPDLVLCGAQSSDTANGATGVALAALLALPHVAVVKGIRIDAGTATVERELEGGLVEVLSVRLPALLTVQTGVNQPRHATLRAIKQARAKPLETVGLEDLGLDACTVAASAGARVRRAALPSRVRTAEMLEGSSAMVAARIAEIIRNRVSP
jgi:electron transfer flavoprotein beta subunit